MPARHIGHPEDIAVFLSTTPFSTGSTILVDSGGAIA
jgi:hypothetical protein